MKSILLIATCFLFVFFACPPRQVADSFANRYPAIQSKAVAIDNNPVRDTITGKEFTIYSFTIDYTYQQRHHAIQNVGYIIEVNNKRVFHAGDADGSVALFQKLGLKEYNIDVAILPNWLICGDADKRILEQIKARHYIITHNAPGVPGDYMTACSNKFPQEAIFLRMGQKASF